MFSTAVSLSLLLRTPRLSGSDPIAPPKTRTVKVSKLTKSIALFVGVAEKWLQDKMHVSFGSKRLLMEYQSTVEKAKYKNTSVKDFYIIKINRYGFAKNSFWMIIKLFFSRVTAPGEKCSCFLWSTGKTCKRKWCYWSLGAVDAAKQRNAVNGGLSVSSECFQIRDWRGLFPRRPPTLFRPKERTTENQTRSHWDSNSGIQQNTLPPESSVWGLFFCVRKSIRFHLQNAACWLQFCYWCHRESKVSSSQKRLQHLHWLSALITKRCF